MLKVFNKYSLEPNWQNNPYFVYIGRGSIFGNPFIRDKDHTREQVIQKFRTFFYSNESKDIREAAIQQLQNKGLVCFCAPKACHGDIIKEFLENYQKEQEKMDDFTFHTKLAGSTFNNREQRIKFLISKLGGKEKAIGHSLILKRDPNNQYDKNAIAVGYQNIGQLGFIPAKTAVKMAPRMDNEEKITCKIAQITGGEDGKENYGINLEITYHNN